MTIQQTGWHGFVEPKRWDDDGTDRREPVVDADHKPPRVVRHVGWRSCMACRRRFFSEDVVRQRICPICKMPEYWGKPPCK